MCEVKHKHYDFIVAWAAGKKIEYYSNGYSKWMNTSQPGWYDHCEYRIKPEPKPDVVKYAIIADAGDYFHLFNTKIERSTMKLTFDGETGKLKSVEMI